MKIFRRIISFLLSMLIAAGILLLPLSAADRGNADAKTDTAMLPSEDTIAAMPKFDGRDYGIITPIKDQGLTNLCWAYSAVAASEASILRSGINPLATAETLNLNPTAAAYRVANRRSDPLGNTDGELIAGNFTDFTGNPGKIATLFSLWWGPVSGTSAAADPFENSEYRLENAVYIPEYKGEPALHIAAIKRAIAKYGAVTFQYNNASNQYYYNPKNETGAESYPHACTIIGWDDSIPADRFLPGGATQSGGWLIKNSYASLPDGYPYFYISYDNTCSQTYAFSYVPREKYDNNYYYDGAMNDFPLRNDRVVANVYQAAGADEAGKAEVLKAVNVGVSGTDFTLEVEIYTGLSSPFGAQDPPTAGGSCAAKATGHFEFGGYVTLALDSAVPLAAGEWFSVIVRVTEGNAKIRLGEKNGKDLSYAGTSGGFTKLGNYVGRIKALSAFEDTAPEWDDAESTFTNLVVLANFKDEESFAQDVYQGATVLQILDNTYNRAEYSVRDYLSSVSNGKLKMQTLFLLDGDQSLTLSKPRGYYAEKDDFNPGGYEAGEENLRSAELREDWANALSAAVAAGNLPIDRSGKTHSLDELDQNGDGKIDCITVIYKPTTQNISVGWGSPLWDYKYYNSLVTFSTAKGELRSDAYVQLTLSYMTADGRSALYQASDVLPIVSLGKICHETLHVLGLKDLYRTDFSGEVYYMSAMGKPLSPAVQFISVKEREALGFLTEDEVLTLSRDGTYSLSVSAPYSEGVVGYKLSLPQLGKTLYLEYRRFDGALNKYDTKEKELYACSTGELVRGQTLKSGLVCYLAKSGVRFPSNLNGTDEYVVLSGGIYQTKSDAAIAPGESIDITNEISVTVTEMTDEKLQFSISGITGATPPHTHTLIWSDEVAASCINSGVRAHYRCAFCGEYFLPEDKTAPVSYSALVLPINAQAHSLRHVSAVAPSCTEGGWDAYTVCTLCGYTTKVEKGALGHEYVHHEAKAPSCTEAGWDAYDTCTRCDYTTKVEKPALGHDPVHHAAKPATCTEAGYKAYDTCNRCDYTTYEAEDALGHDIKQYEAKAPSCTEAGWDAYEACTRCDYTTKVEKPALGHDPVHHDAKAQTCTEAGWDAYDTCTRCDYTTKVEKPALGHDLAHHAAKPATCTEAGYKAYDTCNRCDYTTYEAEDALGHEYIHHEAKAPSCTEAGWDAYDTCTRCDYTTKIEKPALGHVPGEWIVEKEATETEDGYRYKKCTVCEEKVAEEVIPRLAWVNPFVDVPEDKWFYASVKYANQNNLFKGTSDTTFEPNTPMNRAMFCRVLANLEGVDNENNLTVDRFSDVLSGKWYTKAVKWAADTGIVSGYPGGIFLPEQKITRQEMCLMLANYAKYLSIYDDLAKKEDNGVAFADAAKIATWASEAVNVMKNNGYIVGKPIDGTYEFQPQATATRAEVATIFRAFCMANPTVLKK